LILLGERNWIPAIKGMTANIKCVLEQARLYDRSRRAELAPLGGKLMDYSRRFKSLRQAKRERRAEQRLACPTR